MCSGASSGKPWRRWIGEARAMAGVGPGSSFAFRNVASEEVAVDRNRMLLIGSAIVLVLFIAYMMFGPGGPSVPH